MNSIPDLIKQYDETMIEIIKCLKVRPFNTKEVKVLERVNKQYEGLSPKIHEESLVLKAMKKENSPTLIRYNAKLQVMVFQLQEVLQNMPKPSVVIPQPKVEVVIPSAEERSFALFCRDRVRQLRDGYDVCVNEKATLKDIIKAYQRWCIVKNGQKMDHKTIEMFCEKVFDDSRGKGVYSHLKVFLDEDDVEDFDKEQETMSH